MARYIQQPNFNLPNRGVQNIAHYVEILDAADTATLQTVVNVFLDSLMGIPETPQIIGIDYSSALDSGTAVYTALIHYVLIS